jgi:Zn-dependent peptidase ImmA (M78 family)
MASASRLPKIRCWSPEVEYGGTGRLYDPWLHAEGLGVRVIEGRLRRNRWGEYRDADRLIVLARGMTHRSQRTVLAHEVQHAITRDVLSLYGAFDNRLERRARINAAAHLICPTEYAEAERLFGPHDAYIADELNVVVEVLSDWRRFVAPAVVSRREAA